MVTSTYLNPVMWKYRLLNLRSSCLCLLNFVLSPAKLTQSHYILLYSHVTSNHSSGSALATSSSLTVSVHTFIHRDILLFFFKFNKT